MKTSRTVAHTSRPMLRAFRGAFFLSFSTVVQEDDDGDSDGVCCLTHLLPFLGDVFLRVFFFCFSSVVYVCTTLIVIVFVVVFWNRIPSPPLPLSPSLHRLVGSIFFCLPLF